MDIFTKEKIWNFISIVVYAILIFLVGYLLQQLEIELDSIPVWNWIIMALATFRLTRMVVYDRIFKFLRDFIKPFSRRGIVVSLRSLFTCPWCAGVWVALIVFVLKVLVPYGELMVYLLAISGVATFIQLMSGSLSLSINRKEIELNAEESKKSKENK